MFGKIYEGITPGDVMADVDGFAQSLLENKALVLRGFHPSEAQFVEVIDAIARMGDDATRGCVHFNQDHKAMFDTDWTANHDHDPLNSHSFEAGWHLDNGPAKKPVSVVGIHMHTFKCPPGEGNTVLLDLEQLYEQMDDWSKEYCRRLEIDHRHSGYESNHPDIQKDDWIHPAMRIHPVTGKPCFYWSGMGCSPGHLSRDDVIYDNWGGLTEWVFRKDPEFKQFFEPILALIGRGPDGVQGWAGEVAPEMTFTQEWREGDAMIWDNRNIVHTFFGGWKHGERVFHKVEHGREPVVG